MTRNKNQSFHTDADLLQRFVQQQDQEALTSLIEKYSALVMSVCRQVLRNRHDAEDVFQAVFMKLVHKADTIQNGELLASWLYRVAHREAVQSTRRQQKHSSVEFNDELISAESMNQKSQSSEAQFHILHEEVDKLPEPFRGPIVLCYLNGMTRKEAADELEATDASVKARLSNGREMLRERLLKRGMALTAVIAAWETSHAEAATWTTTEFVQQTVDQCLLQTNAGAGAVAGSQTVISQGTSTMTATTGTTLAAWIGGALLLVGIIVAAFALNGSDDSTQAEPTTALQTEDTQSQLTGQPAEQNTATGGNQSGAFGAAASSGAVRGRTTQAAPASTVQPTTGNSTNSSTETFSGSGNVGAGTNSPQNVTGGGIFGAGSFGAGAVSGGGRGSSK